MHIHYVSSGNGVERNVHRNVLSVSFALQMTWKADVWLPLPHGTWGVNTEDPEKG